MKLYKCCSCGIEKTATSENFFPVQLEKLFKKPHISSLGKCSDCAKKYQLEYTEKLKQKKLSRSRNPVNTKKTGTLYVIGPKNNVDLPYKIGITCGHNIKGRLVSIQTAHWLEMEVYYSSPLLNDVCKIEKHLHKKYIDKKVKGEWFNINIDDIENIKMECESLI